MRRQDLLRICCAVLALVSAAEGQAATPAQAKGEQATGASPAASSPLLTYCDLVGSPRQYLDHEVRVVGIFRVGFEWQQLYSSRCADSYTTWLEWGSSGSRRCADLPGPPEIVAEDSSGQDSSSEEEKHIELQGATLGVIVRGTLTGGDGVGYGHLNAFTFQFDVSCVESVELLDRRSYTVHALTPDMRKKIERFLAKTDPASAVPHKPE